MERALSIFVPGFIAALGTTGITGPARAADESAPGRLISVADAMLHVYCVGHGTPAVVFDAGLGGNYLDWTFVQAKIAETHRACALRQARRGLE